MKVEEFESRVSGVGFRVSGFGFRVSGSGFQISGFEFRVSGLGFRAQGTSRVMAEKRGSPFNSACLPGTHPVWCRLQYTASQMICMKICIITSRVMDEKRGSPLELVTESVSRAEPTPVQKSSNSNAWPAFGISGPNIQDLAPLN